MSILAGLAVALLVVGLPLTGAIWLVIYLNQPEDQLSGAARLMADVLAIHNKDEQRGQMPVTESLKDAREGRSTAQTDDRPPSRAELPRRVEQQVAAAAEQGASVAGFEPLLLSEAVYLIDKAHHVAILGGTGNGKTWMGRALIQLLPVDQLFCVIDCNWFPGKWGTLPVITTTETDNFKPILAGLQGIQREARARKLLTWQGKDANPGPRLNVIWDEVNETMEELPDAGEYLRRWLRRVRYLNMKLYIFPQSERVGALGLEGHGDAKKNMLWVYLGDDARTKADWLMSKKRISTAIYDYVNRLEYPCLMEWQSGFYAVSLDEVPALVSTPIPDADKRAWTPAGVATKQDLTDDLALTEEEQDAAALSVLETPQGDAGKGDRVSILIEVINLMDWSIYAQQVAAKTATETGIIQHLFKVKPGGSPVYQAAKVRLQEALNALLKEEQQV